MNQFSYPDEQLSISSLILKTSIELSQVQKKKPLSLKKILKGALKP